MNVKMTVFDSDKQKGAYDQKFSVEEAEKALSFHSGFPFPPGRFPVGPRPRSAALRSPPVQGDVRLRPLRSRCRGRHLLRCLFKPGAVTSRRPRPSRAGIGPLRHQVDGP